ncbi:hypothetical protein ALO40_102265 [Pseudomonas syringae pv. viburni]|uniref:Uncharacterized protein n=1 Tax=Pseudomonas syringae pv. viburni TaxID=251703 RepID=A0A0Q0JBD6_9PSED|nr:hypothetical protein ALO40_102265 [Pseudomonas syringae pv. viburni]
MAARCSESDDRRLFAKPSISGSEAIMPRGSGGVKRFVVLFCVHYIFIGQDW